MEQTWQERLAEILAKESEAVTPGDAEFLRARRSYLTPEQAEIYAAHLGSKADEPEDKPKKKGKKEE
jgi:hypothetical protein